MNKIYKKNHSPAKVCKWLLGSTFREGKEYLLQSMSMTNSRRNRQLAIGFNICLTSNCTKKYIDIGK